MRQRIRGFHRATRPVIELVESRCLLAVVPAGFTHSQIAANLTGPAALDVAPDGRVFFAEQSGRIRIVQNDQLLATPFADLTAITDGTGERGMLGITLDPNFASNRHVYVYYSAKSPASHNRLSRLTADPNNPNQMLAGSELPLLDLPDLGEIIWHMGGSIQFGPDGRIYVAVGDHLDPSASQSLDTVFGKILRVNADGSIPIDNPFYTQTTGINRSIWATGLRNPFTTAFQPGSGKFFINDVGQNTWEEINLGVAGANYGWPTTEGDFDQSAFPAFTRPFHSYLHVDGQGAITGGAFYNPASVSFPQQYFGKYFYFDFTMGEMWTIDPSTKNVEPFASGLIFANGLDVGPDGALWYVARGMDTSGFPAVGTGGVFKISFTANVPPTISSHPQDRLVSGGYPATFSVNATGSAPLSYQWTRDNIDIPGATGSTYTIPSTSLGDNGAVFRVRVANTASTITSNPATLTVTANVPPIATIESPGDITYRGGDTINFSGSGFDPELGLIGAASMTWRVDFHHDEHSHPFMPSTSNIDGGSFTIPNIGHTEANVWYRIHLTVTDAAGLSHEVFRDVMPVKAKLTLKSNIPGLQIRLDGSPHPTTYSVEGVAGIIRSLDVAPVQNINGQSYQFTGWSDGGAINHTFTFPDADTTVTANFVPLTIKYVSELPFVGAANNGWGPVEQRFEQRRDRRARRAHHQPQRHYIFARAGCSRGIGHAFQPGGDELD